MSHSLPIHNEPENNVYGLPGNLLTNDSGIAYVKLTGDITNTGWSRRTPPLQFEKVSLSATTQYGTSSNSSPKLKFYIPSGTAKVKVDVKTEDGHVFSSGEELIVIMDGFTVVTQNSGSSGSYTTDSELGSGLHIVQCTVRSVNKTPITMTVTKVGGFGKPFSAAQAIGKISSDDQLILKIHNTNQFSNGRARFYDITDSITPQQTDSDYLFNLQSDPVNNYAIFGGGGEKVFVGQYITPESSDDRIGLVEVTDIGNNFVENPTDDSSFGINTIYWIGSDLSASAYFTEGSAGSSYAYLYNVNDFAVPVTYSLTSPAPTGTSFKSPSTIVDNFSTTIGARSVVAVTASYVGSMSTGSMTLAVSGSDVGRCVYDLNVIAGPVPTATPTPLPSIVPTPFPTPTPIIPATPTPVPTSTPTYYLSVNGGQPGIAGTYGSGNYPVGAVVNVGATLVSGYQFNQWSDNVFYLMDGGANKIYTNPNRITMPAASVVLTPTAQLTSTVFEFTYLSARAKSHVFNCDNNIWLRVRTNAATSVQVFFDLSTATSFPIDVTFANTTTAVTLYSTRIYAATTILQSFAGLTANQDYSAVISGPDGATLNSEFVSINRVAGGKFIYGSAMSMIDTTSPLEMGVSGITLNSPYHYNVRNAQTGANAGASIASAAVASRTIKTTDNGLPAPLTRNIGFLEIVGLTTPFTYPNATYTPPEVCYYYDLETDGSGHVSAVWTRCNGTSGALSITGAAPSAVYQTICAQAGTVVNYAGTYSTIYEVCT